AAALVAALRHLAAVDGGVDDFQLARLVPEALIRRIEHAAARVEDLDVDLRASLEQIVEVLAVVLLPVVSQRVGQDLSQEVVARAVAFQDAYAQARQPGACLGVQHAPGDDELAFGGRRLFVFLLDALLQLLPLALQRLHDRRRALHELFAPFHAALLLEDLRLAYGFLRRLADPVERRRRSGRSGRFRGERPEAFPERIRQALQI